APAAAAAMMCPWLEAKPRRPVTARSRPMITTIIAVPQPGMRPALSSTISAVATSSLSARGSSSLPMRVTCCPLRASQPSTRSVSAAAMKSQAISCDPARLGARDGNSSSTGTTAARSRVMVFGRFQSRSAAIGAAAPGAASSAEVTMVAAIIVEDAIDVLPRLRIGGHAAEAVDGARARVVGRQRIAHVAVAIEHRPQVARAAPEVLLGPERIRNPKAVGRVRHQLHEPLGALTRDGLGMEIRLRLHDR